MIFLLDLLSFNSLQMLLYLIGVFAVIAYAPKLFKLNGLNALISAQISLFFNSIAIASGWHTDLISLQLTLHFVAIELSFFLCLLWVYSRLLRGGAKTLNALVLFFDGKRAWAILALSVLLIAFNLSVVQSESGSRIEFMTFGWYSYVKPFQQVIIPSLNVATIVMIFEGRRKYIGYLLLVSSILSNVATGSKASFVFSLLTALLLYRDLKGKGKREKTVSFGKVTVLALLISTAACLTLMRLDVSLPLIGERFMLYSEPTLLTYFSSTPTAACQDVSLFAKLHRGVARLAGDASANNIDTLFGYALTIQELGVNTFTGPNARISAYALCNFPDISLVAFEMMLVLYLLLIYMTYRIARKSIYMLAIAYPYLLYSMANGAQDYNLIMQDITYFLLALLIMVSFQMSMRVKGFE